MNKMNFTRVQNDDKEGRSTFSNPAKHYSYRAAAVVVKPELSAITAPDSIKTFSDPLRFGRAAVPVLAARCTRRDGRRNLFATGATSERNCF